MGSLGLRASSAAMRLRRRLEFFQKLLDENKDKKAMDKSMRRIKRLVWLVEHFNRRKIGGLFDE